MVNNPYNLELFPISSEVNEFEFDFVDSYAFAYSNSNVSDFELTTERRNWNQINFANFDGYTPPRRNAEVLFGAYRVDVLQGSGSNISPTAYDFNFNLDRLLTDPNDYDLNFAQAGDSYTYFYREDEKFAYHGMACEVNLTTERDVLNNDLEVCAGPVGSTIQYVIENNVPNPVSNTLIESNEKYNDGKLLFIFDSRLPCTGDFKPNRIYNGSTVTATLDLDDIEVVTGVESDGNFNLIECTPSTNFDLGECGVGYIYGKNLNYDIKLCPGDTNPAINNDNHNFIFGADFLVKDCEVLELDFYHGSVGEAGFAASIIFNNVDGYHGADGTFDLSVNQNLDADAYTGAYGSTILTSNPADELDGDAHYGADVTFELATILIFQDVDVYHGAYSNLELDDSPAEEIPMDAYHGSYGDFDLNTLPVLQLEPAYNGAYGDTDFTSYPAHELDVDAYTGAYADGDMVVYPQFGVDTYHGAYGDLEFETFPSEGISVVETYHGGDATFELATVAALSPVATHGIYSELDFATTTTISMDGYGGAYADTDFTLNPPDELDSVAEHGSYGEFDMSLTKALFPRAYSGAYADLDLDDHPAIELDLNNYHGSYADVDLTEADFNTFGYHGATLGEFDLQVTVNFPLDEMAHGAHAEADDIKRAAGLDVDVYHGADGYLSNFTVPEGESIVAEAYAGSVLTPSLSAIVTAILTPQPISAAHALRDGLGGVGGINHCPISSDDLDPTYGDNVIRLGFDPLEIDDQLNFSFDDIGDDPWTTCNAGGIAFEVGFQTQPRFEFDCYAGESVNAFFPMELFALIGEDVPLSRLYDYEYTAISAQPIFDLEPIEVQVLVEVWDQPDDFVAFFDQRMEVDLTLTAFGQFDHGSEVEFELATTEYAWKKAMNEFATGEFVQFDFEPIEYTRFCKGYIVPNGNSVVFDFGVDTENYGCTIWIGNAGEYATFELAEYFQPDLNSYSGEYAISSLEVQSLWTLLARGGATCTAQLYDEPEFVPSAAHGSYAQCTFEELPIIGAHGATAALDDLIIPGPGIQWQTETQCLPNEYVPTTSGGDIDYDKLEPDENGVVQYPKVPVEYKEYRYVLDARCITFDQSQSESE